MGLFQNHQLSIIISTYINYKLIITSDHGNIEDNTSWGGIKKMVFALGKLQDAGDIPEEVSLGNITLRQLELIEMYLKHRKDMIGLFAN